MGHTPNTAGLYTRQLKLQNIQFDFFSVLKLFFNQLKNVGGAAAPLVPS